MLPGGSSDDPYLSADEDPAEGPGFEKPLEDTTGLCGSEVTLTCIITGRPAPIGKNNNNKPFKRGLTLHFKLINSINKTWRLSEQSTVKSYFSDQKAQQEYEYS